MSASMAPRPELCPGEGKCHGCLKFCDGCGDRARVDCDDPRCVEHDRSGEIAKKQRAIDEAIQKLSRSMVSDQKRLLELFDQYADLAKLAVRTAKATQVPRG